MRRRFLPNIKNFLTNQRPQIFSRDAIWVSYVQSKNRKTVISIPITQQTLTTMASFLLCCQQICKSSIIKVFEVAGGLMMYIDKLSCKIT